MNKKIINYQSWISAKKEKAEIDNPHLGPPDERLCLYVLHEFNLVPEHIETRKLFNPIQPEMEQVFLFFSQSFYNRILLSEAQREDLKCGSICFRNLSVFQDQP